MGVGVGVGRRIHNSYLPWSRENSANLLLHVSRATTHAHTILTVPVSMNSCAKCPSLVCM